MSVAVGALLLVGCAGPGSIAPSADPTASDSPAGSTPTATPTPSTSPPVNLDDPSSWLIDFTSVGPLALGDPISEVAPAMTAYTTTVFTESCPQNTYFDRSGSPGILIADPSGSGEIELIVVQKWGSSGEAAAVAGTSPRTSAGIGIGATLDSVKAAYPALSEGGADPFTYYSVSEGNGNWLNFSLSTEGLVDTILVAPSPGVPSEFCG